MGPLQQIHGLLSCCLGVVLPIAVDVCFEGCGGGGAAPGPPPPPPPSMVVTVTPGSITMLLGNTQSFTAEVTNTMNMNVSWSVNGIAGGNSAVGTISAN